MVTGIMNILKDFKDKDTKVTKDYSCFIEIIKLFLISIPFIDRKRLISIEKNIYPFQ